MPPPLDSAIDKHDARTTGPQGWSEVERLITDISGASLNFIESCGCPVSLLPFEILHSILEYATPPNIFLDPAICRGPYSAWCQMLRQLKSFVLVCRMWCDVGTDLLYRHVVIRRIGQIPALLRSLQGNPKLGSVVHELQIHCFVPHGCNGVLEQGLAQIWPLCANMTRLAINHQTDESSHEFPGAVLDFILPSIVELEIGWGHHLQHSFSSPLRCKGLVTLSINFEENMDGDAPYVVLELLEELNINWNDKPTRSLNTDMIMVISDRWSLPRLKRLTLLRLWYFSRAPPSFPKDLRPLLRAHGKNLMYLSIHTPFIIPACSDIQKYLDLCPSLKHFSTCEYAGTRGLSHPKLEYLDVWIVKPSESWVYSSQEHLPALRRVRFLDSALSYTTAARLPLVIPPDVLSSSSSPPSSAFQSWRFPGVDVWHDSEGIFQGDVDHLDALCDVALQELPCPVGQTRRQHFRELPFCDPGVEDYEVDTDSEDGTWIFSQTPTDFSDEFDSTDEEPSSPSSPPLAVQLQEALEIFENLLAIEEARLEEEDNMGIRSHTVPSYSR